MSDQSRIAESVAAVTAAADLDTAAFGVDLEPPQALAAAIAAMCAETGEECRRVTKGQTSPKHVPAAPLPEGVSLVDWHSATPTGFPW